MVKPHIQSLKNHQFDVDCRLLSGLADYQHTLVAMEQLVDDIIAGRKNQQLWLLEHPSLYTAGTSAKPSDLLSPERFPVFHSGRGGQYTYHGPGQRICYVMLDLNRRGRDVRSFVSALENWIIKALADFGLCGEVRKDRVGVWVARPDKGEGCEDKIAAIGIRIRRWISFHGIALNVSPQLEHFSGIVPCGISDSSPNYGVTSLSDLGIDVTLDEVDEVLKRTFAEVFGCSLPGE